MDQRVFQFSFVHLATRFWVWKVLFFKFFFEFGVFRLSWGPGNDSGSFTLLACWSSTYNINISHINILLTIIPHKTFLFLITTPFIFLNSFLDWTSTIYFFFPFLLESALTFRQAFFIHRLSDSFRDLLDLQALRVLEGLSCGHWLARVREFF